MTTPPDEVAEALEAIDRAIDSKQRGCLDEWELQLVKRRIAALTAPVVKWQYISTAPKDGTKFTGYSPTLGVRRDVSWNFQRNDFDIGFSCLVRDWTHWQQQADLPAPPAALKE
ncbi:hypothetical protein [Methylobacterium oryzae]|uniref:hypothetical protein n=1 Tax=Methylobacterium oryzae TaxID=334852 RepID=UPI002F35F4D8